MTTALQCLRALSKSGFTPEEIDSLASALWTEQLQQKAQAGLTRDELVKLMDQIFDGERIENIKARQSVANDMRIQLDVEKQWAKLRETEQFKTGKLSFVEFAAAMLVGAGERFEGARASIAAEAVGMYNGTRGRLAADWERIARENGRDKNFIFEALSDPKAKQEQLDFINELLASNEPGYFVMAPKSGHTGNKVMAAAAQALNAITEDMRVRTNRAGGDIQKLRTGYLPQSHDPYKIIRAGMKDWVDFVSEQIDWNRSFPELLTEAQQRSALETMYHTLELNRDLNMQAIDYPTAKTIGYSAHRILHFKDGAAFQAYHAKFGLGSLAHSVDVHIRQGTTRIAMIERLGIRPEAMLRRLVSVEKERLGKAIEDKKLSPQEQKKVKKDYAALQKAYDTKFAHSPAGELVNYMKVLMGETKSPVNITVANISNMIRSFQALVSMGLSGISTLTDINTTMSIQRAFGVDLWEQFGGAVTDYFKVYKGDKRRLAQDLGFLVEATWGHTLSRFDMLDQPPGFLSKAMNKFYKYSGLSPLSEQKKVANALTMSKLFGRSKDIEWKNLDSRIQGGLEYHGFNEGSWNLMRTMTEQLDGEHYLNATYAQRLTEAQLEPYLPAHLQRKAIKTIEESRERLAEFQRIRDRLQSQVLGFFADNSKFAVMEPDAKVTATMTQGQRAGTPLGESLKAIMQFKSWPIMMVQRHMVGQTWKRFNHQGIDVPGAVQFLAMGLTTGYLSQVLKDLARGRTPRAVDSFETLLSASWQAGFLGLYGDIIFGPPLGKGAFGRAALGPIGGVLNDVLDIPGHLVRGEVKEARDRALKTTMGNIPYANLWFTKAAVDYMFLNEMKELLSPGYKRRMVRIMKETYGQRPLF